MTNPFLGEVRSFGFSFAPKNWAMCNGQLLSIQQNAALFALLGTMYGGNGVQTFALPNLQSRVPMHRSGDGTYVQGQVAGSEQVTITNATMPGSYPLPRPYHDDSQYESTGRRAGDELGCDQLLLFAGDQPDYTQPAFDWHDGQRGGTQQFGHTS